MKRVKLVCGNAPPIHPLANPYALVYPFANKNIIFTKAALSVREGGIDQGCDGYKLRAKDDQDNLFWKEKCWIGLVVPCLRGGAALLIRVPTIKFSFSTLHSSSPFHEPLSR